MQSDREFFARHLPTDGDPSAHLATMRRTPVIAGYAEARRYLADVRGCSFGHDRLVAATSSGELAYYPIGRAYQFTADDLDAWLESLRVNAAR